MESNLMKREEMQLLIINIHLQTETWEWSIRWIHLHLSVTKRNLTNGFPHWHQTLPIQLRESWRDERIFYQQQSTEKIQTTLETDTQPTALPPARSLPYSEN